MGSCAFDGCTEDNKATCPLTGGCVVARFEHQPRYKAKTYAEAEGLKQNALSFHGAKKKRASARTK